MAETLGQRRHHCQGRPTRRPRRLRLGTQAEPPHLLEEKSLPGRPGGDDSEVSTRLVGVPDRNGQRPASFVGDADDSHVQIGQKVLSLSPCHRECHGRPPIVLDASFRFSTRYGNLSDAAITEGVKRLAAVLA